MWKALQVFVLSDIHLNVEKNKGMFVADAELASCLLWIAKQEIPSIVILAGDTLDFLVPEKERMIQDFEPVYAASLAESIVKEHKEVFDALSALSEKHTLIIQDGNHDSELILSEVREEIQKHVNGVIRWMVHGEAARIQIGDDTLLVVEHGHLYDSINQVCHEKLLQAVHCYSRGVIHEGGYKAPFGTYLVKKYLHPLRRRCPILEFVKPEVPAVLKILWRLIGWREKIKWLGILKNRIQVSNKNLQHKIKLVFSPQSLFAGEHTATTEMEDFIQEKEQEQEPQQQQNSIPPTQESIMADLQKIARKDTMFDLEAFDENVRYARYLFQKGVKLFVTGHSHAAKAYVVNPGNPIEEGLYMNAGCWVRTISLPQQQDTKQWQDFTQKLLENAPLNEADYRPYTFVSIFLKENTVTASLCAWKKGQEEKMVAWERSATNLLWEKK